MATLTYDPTSADEPEFNEAEQEALAIGEQAVADQEQLLAGKFKDAEALEQAYIELQSKLGTKDESADDEVREQEEPPSEEVTEEPEQPEEESEVVESNFTDEDVARIQSIAGGPEAYEDMLKWAAGALQKPDIEAFDHVIGLNDPQAATFAVMALTNFYKQQVGSEGTLLTGKGNPSEAADVFKSQAQVVEAMSDPKYDRDPAYRQEVMKKLERSNLQY